jgi:hypothetical protein
MRTSPNRLVGIVFGVAYVLVGIVGFVVTFDSGVGFFSTEGGLILNIFEVNIFHNVAHLVVGLALAIASFSGTTAARTINTVVGTTYLLLGIAGLFLVSSAANILAINAADNVLHFASALVLLAVGLGAERRAPTTAG